MIAENESWANPRKIEWGTAPCLVQSTIKAGKITIKARTLLKVLILHCLLRLHLRVFLHLSLFCSMKPVRRFSKSSAKSEGRNNEQIDL